MQVVASPHILRAAKVVVVGVGGTGSAAATALAASGMGRLHLVDDDRVELSNLNRQTLYAEADIGRLKVDAARDRLRRTNSDITVTAQRTRITGPGDLEAILPGCDLLVMCADRPDDIRTWANTACLNADLPWVDGGYHGPLVTVGAYAPHRRLPHLPAPHRGRAVAARHRRRHRPGQGAAPRPGPARWPRCRYARPGSSAPTPSS
ncbi:HesA/MoeB/ThiF family protein [Actinacidiphila glaucinigra]|uniref:HesA/MoeB/ThiF family protein n=1 Tax=Actinacidiphila glaucinigra TaxID=235986 RepID=UPI003AF3680C